MTATLTTLVPSPGNAAIFFTGAKTIASGGYHGCATTGAGEVWCWGKNSRGQLGDGTTSDRMFPGKVSGVEAARISLGRLHSCALLGSGGVRCWGFNLSGQLGDGTTVDRHAPVAPAGLLEDVSVIDAGNGHTCAVVLLSQARCWGLNTNGQLGDGSVTNRLTPVAVNGLFADNIRAITAGGWHTCVAFNTAGPKCWGHGRDGQLGNGTNADRFAPTNVLGMPPVSSIAAGLQHTCAIYGGYVYCWGSNTDGQLGDTTTTNRFTPTLVVGLANVVAISAGHHHNCALTQNGQVFCWGDNFWGQLGAGSSSDSAEPVPVVGLPRATAISAGADHSCAIVEGGDVQCWGANFGFPVSDLNVFGLPLPRRVMCPVVNCGP